MIKGTTVKLYDIFTQTGTDGFGVPIVTEGYTVVDNVLIGEPSSDDIVTATALYQKTIKYMLGIPKGDRHDWVDKKVEWTDKYGNTFTVKTFGLPITGIEANVPTRWHMKMRCEGFE